MLASASALILIAALASCAPVAQPTSAPSIASDRLDFTDGKCPESILWFADGVAVAPLEVTELDEASYEGPVGYPEILKGMTASCVLEVLSGPLDYVYFIGGDEKLVDILVKRLEAANFAAAGDTSSEGGYWVDPGSSTVAAIVYSPDGAETHVFGGEESPPFPGVGTDEQWVAVAFL
jgi:hypothetical protein